MSDLKKTVNSTPPESDDKGRLVIDENVGDRLSEESRNADQNVRLVSEVIQMLEIEEEMTRQMNVASPIPTPVIALPAPVGPEDESSSTDPIGQQHQSTEELIRVHDSEDVFHKSDVGSVIEGTPFVRRIKKPNRASKRGSVGDVDEFTKRTSQRLTDKIESQSQDASTSSNGRQPRTTDEADSTENSIDASQLELSTPAVNPSSSSNGQQPLHQPKMYTRAKGYDLYDDNDEKQNELIGKEAGYANSTNKPKESELSRFELFRVQCQLSKLPAPLPFEVFDKKDWNYVTTFDKELLAPDESFPSVHALAEIPRCHGRFPVCHPGPVVDTVSGTEDWYYADYIVQEVKLVGRIQPYYIVRWIGYEDSYNTVEPQSNLVVTAVLILHQKRDHFIGAAGASGPTVLRRSTRIMAKRFEQVLHNGNEQVLLCRELQLLESLLEREDISIQRITYSLHLNFTFRLTSLPYTLQTQFDFIEKVFFFNHRRVKHSLERVISDHTEVIDPLI
ncbi:uncharacterized protein LOC119075575 [Bradysia coprophila]|uniref:uncharacterized protein LOC119075575 n=1 Tax=Bradysia coprophila TaxID=38358 RepID=UPI00187D80BF|nr:uncharacterized protein LOC119075575 [Bradysia coprophila]